MPYINFKEIWTPLVIFKIRLYKDIITDELYYKKGNRKRKKLRMS